MEGRAAGPAEGPVDASPRRPAAFAAVLLWVLPAIWSSNYLIARAAVDAVPPHVLAFGRWALVVLALLLVRGPALWRQRAVLRAEAGQLFVLGGLGMWICGAWVYLGGRSTPATNIGLIYAVAPVGITLGSQWLLGERAQGRQGLATAMALAGVLFVVLHGEPARLLALQFSTGDLWMVGATTSWIAYSLLVRRWPSRLSAVDRLCGCAAMSLIWLLPFTAVELLHLPGPLPARGWGLIGLAALLPGLLAYLAYAYLQREVGVARAGLVLYLAPVYGALLAWAVLGEPPHWYHAVGAALILPALYLSGRK